MRHDLNTKYYFINNFDTNNIDFQDKRTIIIYRNYNSEKVSHSEILKFKNCCKQKGLKFYLSNNVKLAIKLGLNGAYIPSFNKKFDHLNYSYHKDFKLVGSAHNLKEIRIKELQKVNKIFLSSLFKKNKNYLGINKFKLLSDLTKKNTVVLGGIAKKNIKLLKLLKSSEFAGISFFE
jgi:thiamine-phosphate pyrophosphorylase